VSVRQISSRESIHGKLIHATLAKFLGCTYYMLVIAKEVTGRNKNKKARGESPRQLNIPFIACNTMAVFIAPVTDARMLAVMLPL
jgi:hypothetical protein